MAKCKSILIPSVLALLLLEGQLFAQAVTMKLMAPKPLELTIEDCVSATITSPVHMKVYAIGQATEAEKGLIARVTTDKFDINPGVNQFGAGNLPSIAQVWIAPEFERIIKQTGKFPEGNYTISIELYSEQNALLADDQRTQETRSSQINLIAPGDGSLVSESYPLFQWQTTGGPTEGTYQLDIFQVRSGETARDAISKIPYFEQRNISTTSFRYPTAAQAFETGSKYCWQVQLFTGTVPLAVSNIWLFDVGTTVAVVESCKYYLDEKGQMWHSLGRAGQIGIRPDSCTYVLTKDTVMYHADGKQWGKVTADSCTFIIAKNGVFHFNGRYWHQIAVEKCNCVLTKTGMFHYDGQAWEAVKPDSCTYVLVKDEKGGKKMEHADGKSWTVVTFEKCKYILTKYGMYHFNGQSWDPIIAKECTGIRAENGMFHFDGKNWVVEKPDSCRYFMVSDPVNNKNAMYHGDGRTWTVATFVKCKYIRALNGMFHFNGTTWDPIKAVKCTSIRAENGMYHFDGTTWTAIKPDSCTYMLVSDPVNKKTAMFHADGKIWNLVTLPKCHYIKAYNGMFHFDGVSWVPINLPLCKYVKADNGMFHSLGGGQWETVPGYFCQWIEAENGWFHYDGTKWNPPVFCNYRFEVTATGQTDITGKVWHYDGKKWVVETAKAIRIGKPENCPFCTYYFVQTAPKQYTLYHCIKDNQPKELARIRLP